MTPLIEAVHLVKPIRCPLACGHKAMEGNHCEEEKSTKLDFKTYQQMEQSNELYPMHAPYWSEPEKYALVKEKHNIIEYYSIYRIEPNLSMLLCDDFNYALKLANKMIDNGVKVFDDFLELYNWAKIK